jgi:hypothetical protein
MIILLLLQPFCLLYYVLRWLLQMPTYANTYAYAYDDPIYAIHFFSQPTSSETVKNILEQAQEASVLDETSARPEVNVATWIELLQTRPNTSATRHRDWIHNTHTSSTHKFNMSDNKKQEKDYTKEVDALLPEAAALIKVPIFIFDIDLSNLLAPFSPVNSRRALTRSLR